MSAPDAIQNANALLTDVRLLVRENKQSVNRIMGNLEKLSEELAGSSGDISETLGNINTITSDVAAATSNLESVAGTADELLENDVAQLIREAKGAAASYGRVAEELEMVLSNNRSSINSFTRDGLGQLPLLIEEARDMVAALERFVSRAEGDPAGFFLGSDTPEYEPESGR